MSHRFAALSLVLAAVLVTASVAAIWVGVTDTILTLSGPKRRVEASALGGGTRGWFAVEGCVRHDLGVVVTADGVVYRLGERGPEADDADRVYTPIAARGDCDDDRPPSRIYALIEDAEAMGMALNRSSSTLVAPPSVPATVEGTIGPRIGDAKRARKARAKLAAALPTLPGLDDAPLLRKNARPGVLWVGLFTCGAGLHGFLLLALGVRYLRRRNARREALRHGQVDEEEEQFFRSETLD